MFCPKCGKELPDGSAFCSSCGTNVSTMGGPAAAPKQPSAAGAAFSGLGGFLKAYFTAPVQATRNTLAKRDLATPLILLGVQLIAAILMALGPCAKISMMTHGYMSIPFTSWFFGGLLGDALAAAIFMGLLFAGAKILKSNCSFLDVVIANGCHSVFVTIMMLVTFLFFLISYELGTVLAIVTLILWVALGVSSFQLITPEMESGKSWLLYLGAVAITAIVVWFIVSMLMMNGLMTAVGYGLGSSYLGGLL